MDDTGGILGCPVEEQLSLLRRVEWDMGLRDTDMKRMAQTYPYQDTKRIKLWENASQHALLIASFKKYKAWVIQKDSRWICDEVKEKAAASEKASFDLHADSVRIYGRGQPIPPSTEKEKGSGPLIQLGSSLSPILIAGAAIGIATLLATRR